MVVKVPRAEDQAYVVATVADRLGSKVLVKLGKVPEVQMFKPWHLFKPKSINQVVNRQLHTHRRV
jgi:hypothetical protein